MKSGGDVNPRERARLMYLRSGCKKSLQIISEEIGVSLNTVKSWKRRDKWDEDPKAVPKVADATAPATADAPENATPGAPKPKRKRGGQPGNKNAVHNQGGGQIGNQNAVTTGEYAQLLFSDLSDDERRLMESVPECTVDLMRRDLALLCVREKRMLARIDGLVKNAKADMMYNEITTFDSTVTRGKGKETTSSRTTSITPVIDRIGDIEEALTRVRREKQRIINALNDYELKQAKNQGSGNAGLGADFMGYDQLFSHPVPVRAFEDVEDEGGEGE